ncbi:MAG TPA: PH domain-containing protein, partial [Roseiflexaceae bacterium]|nr:PH domain-containing protein [Roseiflexaceae bacterium]
MILALAACWWPFHYLRAAFSGTPDTWRLDLHIYGWIVLLLGLLLVAAMLAYRVAGALTLGYELDRNGLYISWLGNRAIIPLDQIESVEAGATGLRMPWGPLQQVGYWWGRAYDADRPVHLFSTRNPRRALLINTAAGGYVVSPVDFDTFVQDLEQRRNLGATKPLAPTIQAGRMFLYDFWNDRTVRWLMIVAVLLNLLALALLA